VYGRGNCGISGERECKREKNDGKIQIWKKRKEGAECAMRREIKHLL
jgi:hypothetical protein